MRASTAIAELTLGQRPKSLSEVVYETIHAAIVDKALGPGEPLSEPALAERLGVSKTPVREALLRLRQSGLVEPDGQRGLRVVRFSSDALRVAYEMREALEPFIARRCAIEADATLRAEISRLAGASLERARAGDQDGFHTHDARFHVAIAATTANPRIAGALDAARDLIATLRERDLPHASAVIACGEDHVRIAAAVERGDAAVAAAEMSDHVAKVKALVLAAARAEETER